MKGQDRTMIVIGVIFIILFSVWIVVGDMGKINLWNWVQTIWTFLNMIWDYIYKERTWTIPSLIAIVAILLHISKKHKTSVGSSRKESMEDTFEEEHITTLELEKEDHQALSTYLDKERKDIFHTIAPGSTTLLVGDIVGSDELFIQLPWANYQGKVRSDELVGYLIQVLSQDNQILVLGEPGQGKTTILKRAFTIMADHFIQGSSDVVPIYVTLRDVPYSEDESGETLLLWKYLCKKRNAFPLPYKHFISLLQDNRIIFLFDGFDEITVGLSQRSINRRISSEIFSQLSILSCRRNFYELYLSTSEIQQKYLEKIELLPLNFTHARQYITAFCNKKGIESEKIIMAIRGNQELLDLAQRPLLLIMMLDIFTDQQETLEIDWNVAKLYEAYTEKWLKNEATKPDSVLRWHEKTALMEEVAWSIYRSEAPSSYSYSDKLYHATTFTRADLSNYLQPHIIHYQNIPLAQIVDDMGLRTFLIGSHGDYYFFIHKSFQEYYVAKHILRSMQCSAESTAQALQVSTPAEVATFLEAMLGSKHIPKHEEVLIVNNLIVAYQQNNGDDLRSLIIREHASYYLARIGAQNAVKFLERAIEEEPNKWVQRGMMVGLGIFCGREDVIERYIDMLYDDLEAASINIGYNLSYYGDLPLEEGYHDRKGGKCDCFVRAIFRHLKSEKHKAIWALDLHTLHTLLQDEQRGISILRANDEHIPFLMEFLSKDCKDCSRILNREKNLLQSYLETYA